MTPEEDQIQLLVDGRRIAADHLGYLLDPDDWDERVAEAIAAEEGIELSEHHWAVIRLVRAGFERNQTVPEARTLLKDMRAEMGNGFASRRYLHRLFPYGYGPQVCRIAGMKMPRKVMLDV
jgi:tRNA 2-thiouridine synthesizing protein E